MLCEVLTIDEYCKRLKISDSGARKRVKQKKVKSAIIDDELHILLDSDLKQKLALKNAQIVKLKQFKKLSNVDLERIEHLENKIDDLHREHKKDLIQTIQGTIQLQLNKGV